MKLTLACLALLGSVGSAMATEALYRCADGTVARAVFSCLLYTSDAADE